MDGSLAHPWNGEIISQASEVDRNLKVNVQQKTLNTTMNSCFGNISNCSSLVFEYFVIRGDELNSFLQELSELSVDENGQKNGRDCKVFWRWCFSGALQCCNTLE